MDYIVLRDRSHRPSVNPYAGLRPLGLNTSRPPEPAIDFLSLDTKKQIRELNRDPEVLAIARPMPVSLIKPMLNSMANADVETDVGATWGVQATGTLRSPYTGQGVTVAVLDTGIDFKHEAFAGVNLVQQDFTHEGDGDQNGHGTHCAGTIFGRAHEGLRFAVAPGVTKALIGKVLTAQGHGSTQAVCDAILWAAEQGAHVISMSFGLDFPGLSQDLIADGYPASLATSIALEAYRANLRLFDSLAELIRARGSFFQGTLLIAAAGNESRRDEDPHYEVGVSPPAVADGIVAVGALETPGPPHDKLTVASFSNTWPDVCGPGVNIYSVKAGGGYLRLDGTSMATPHVAGVAALWADKLIQTTGRVTTERLNALVMGRADMQSLAVRIDPSDVGGGLVQAPQD
jgi:subtilisin family serine protease